MTTAQIESTPPGHTHSNLGGLSVAIDNVSRSFGNVTALDKLDLNIPAGEFISILGPSGCGKSTLLRMIAKLDKPSSGSITVGREEGRPKLAYVFQDAHLLPWRNVLRNVALPLELMGVPKSQRLDSARQVIEQVGLSDAIRRYPGQLSGGMKMRVSLARALVTNPQLLLLDEPFAALDEITRLRLDEQLRQLWIDRKMTVVFVTHSISEAAFLAGRAVVMSKRPGRIVHDDRVNLSANRPAEMRGSPEFARETGVLLSALIAGGI